MRPASFDIDLVAQDEFGDLAKSELDGVHVFENRQMDFGSGVIAIHAAIVKSHGAALLMVVTELVVFQSGRPALSSVGLNVLTRWCFVWHECVL